MPDVATQDRDGFRPPEIWSRCVPSVFEGVVERFPDRIAVVCGAERVSYQRLNERANSVAAALLDAGLSAEEPVAVAVPKSVAQIASLLGVLKAGGAYVPIVTNQPVDRLSRIVRDAGCRFALASPGYADAALERVGVRIDPGSLPVSSCPNPGLRIGADHLAYIMYTSGSTGVPKGVMVEHAGVVRLVHGQDYMPFGPGLNFLYGGPLSFDLSTIEIYTPLLHGATLLISDDPVLSPETIRRFAEEEELRGVCISFSLFRALFEADAGAFERVPVIGVCGEPADARFMRTAQDRLPDATFYNAYGPTECTALSTTHRIPRPCPVDPAIVPIGTPLRGMTVRIVDEQGRPVPPGVKGELVIGGVGVGRGYLNDPTLTAERFIPDMAGGGTAGGRAYRSGDLVRALPDGVIAYAGRSDDQVKIRGQRIELGEIDAALAADPFVKAGASVVVGAGEHARVGVCVVPRDPLAFNAAALVDRLAERLTSAMLPSLVVPVESIPINRNGKADRAASRRRIEEFVAYDAEGAPGPISGRGPRTDSEAVLLQVAESVIGGACGLDRSWARNGGDSLRAMILRIRLRERMGVDISVASILTAPDLGAIAVLLASAPSVRGEVCSELAVGPVPLSPAQRRLWTVQRIDPDSGAYHVAYRFAFKRPPDKAAFERAWQDLHDRHPALRTGFPADEHGEPEGVLAASVASAVEWNSGPGDADELQRWITEPFDLARPPLTRVRVGVDGDGTVSGMLVMHHIITDAWSMDIVFRDLEALYRHHRDGIAADLPPALPGAPAHSALLRAVSHTDAVRSQAERAAALFRGMVPTYAPRTPVGEDLQRAESSAVAIDADLQRRIERAAAETGVSVHAVLLAGFARWAGELGGVEEPGVGLAFSNRDDGPFADAVGFFVETVPVRVRAAGVPLEDLLRHAQAAAEEGRERRSVPFDLLARLAGNPGVPGRTPITEMFLNVIDPAPLSDAHADDREIQPDPVEIDHTHARFDLLCTVYRARTGWRVTVAARRGCWRSGGRVEEPRADAFVTRLTDLLAGGTPFAEPAAPLPVSDAPRPLDRPEPNAVDPLTESVMWDIVSVFRSVLGRPGIGPDDDFFRVGGDSLRALRAFSMVRQTHPTPLTTAAMFGHATAKALAREIRAHEPGRSVTPFMRFSEPDRRHTAFVFPGVTGDALSMRTMLGALGDDWSSRAAMYPGTLGDRPPPPLESLSALVDHFVPDLEAEPTNDAVVIGYSFGGIVAYELAVRLQEQGRTPRLLVLIDTALMKRFPLREGSLPVSVHLERFRAHDWAGRRRHLARVGAGLWRRLRSIGRREESYDQLPEIRRLSSAHLRAIRDYRPSAPYGGATLVIRAVGQDGGSGGGRENATGDRTNGWGPFLTQQPVVVDLATDHVGLMKSDATVDVARAIRETVSA